MDEEKAKSENEEKRFDLELDLDLDILSDNIAGDISTQHILVKNHFQIKFYSGNWRPFHNFLYRSFRKCPIRIR